MIKKRLILTIVLCLLMGSISFSAETINIESLQNEIEADEGFLKVYQKLQAYIERTDTPLESKIQAYLFILEMDYYADNQYSLLKNATALLHLGEDHKNEHAKNWAYLYIGAVYAKKYNPSTAFSYWRLARNWAVVNDSVLNANILYFKAHYFMFVYSAEQAEDYLNQALKAYEDINLKRYYLIPYQRTVSESDMLTLEILKGTYKESEIHNRLNHFRRQLDTNPTLTKAYQLYQSAFIYHHYEAHPFAKRDYKRALNLLKKAGLDKLYSEFINAIIYNLSDVYYNEGQYKEALDVFSEMSELTVPFDNYIEYYEENDALFQSLEAMANEKKINYQQNALIASIAMILILFLAIVIVYRLYLRNKKLTKEVYLKSITDALTGIYNRGAIIDYTETITPEDHAIALIDIDHFKKINDQYGHQAGDEVLIEVSKLLTNLIEPYGKIGRYGGEEFLAIIDLRKCNTPEGLFEAIRQNIQDLKWSFAPHSITVSIGLLKHLTKDFDEDFKICDNLLYKAKDTGRNRICYDHISTTDGLSTLFPK